MSQEPVMQEVKLDGAPVGKKLRIAMIGAGNIAGTHLSAYAKIPQAEVVAACDIDPVAVRIAKENCVLNQTENVTAAVSDLLRDVPAQRYDVCVANIVADVIIRMAPDIGRFMKEDAVLIVSGIIEERADEVLSVLSANGLQTVDGKRENGWYAGVVTKR